jgi:hypothetical protein
VKKFALKRQSQRPQSPLCRRRRGCTGHLKGFTGVSAMNSRGSRLRVLFLILVANVAPTEQHLAGHAGRVARRGARHEQLARETISSARQFFGLLLKKNGYVLEQLFSPLIVHTTPEHAELKATCCSFSSVRRRRGNETHSSTFENQSLLMSSPTRNGSSGGVTKHHSHHCPAKLSSPRKYSAASASCTTSANRAWRSDSVNSCRTVANILVCSARARALHRSSKSLDFSNIPL